MMFMGSSPVVKRIRLAREWRVANGEWKRTTTRYSPLAIRLLHSRHIELRLLAGAVAPERAGFADRVGALENPVLPRRQPREDFRFHGFGADEAQIGFHAGEAVGRERGALLEKHPDLVVPVEVVEREGDEAERFGGFGIERFA